MKMISRTELVKGMAPKPTKDQSTYRKFDKPVVPQKSNSYTRYDGTVLTKKQKHDYDVYHASKGKKS